MKMKRLVYGIGKNDVPGGAGSHVDGKYVHDPFYCAWHGMLMRCYSEKYQARYPSYKDCVVCPEWLKFSAFKAWMLTQQWEGMALDKDLIVPGNKTYSPDRCALIPKWLNNFLNSNPASRGQWPTGVFRFASGRFSAAVMSDGKTIHIGRFDTPEQAHQEYLKAKSGLALDRAERYIAEGGSDARVVAALNAFSQRLIAA